MVAGDRFLQSILPTPPADPALWEDYQAALDDIAAGMPRLQDLARERKEEPQPEHAAPAPSTDFPGPDPEAFRRA
ncbi:MAG TPA: hypothetical protein VGR26_15065 [Acidimicrobiales bacterium]|nr:hypothetical protein [Acidimicrobiales bacterium]